MGPKSSTLDRISMLQPENYAQSEKRCQENICHTRQQTKKVLITLAVVVSDGDEPLDWGTNDGASQASVNDDIAEVAGFSETNLVNYFDNDDPNSYEDPNLHRQVNSITITQEEFNSLHKQLQILVATVDSLSSDCNNKNKFFACNSSNCVKCKDKESSDLTFPGDSGASQMFTSEISDFSTYEKITNGLQVQTADKKIIMHIVGKGTVFITHEVETNSGKISTRSGVLHVYHIPGLLQTLFSFHMCTPCFYLLFFIYDRHALTLRPTCLFTYAYLIFTLHFTCVHLKANTPSHLFKPVVRCLYSLAFH